MKRILAPLIGLALAACAVPASAEPALWKVQGPRGVVYLFGTVHVLKKDTVWRSPKIEAAFKSAGGLWEEIKDADDAAAAQPIIMKYGIDPAHPLSSKLDDAGKAEMAAVEAKLGIPPAQLEIMRPWLASLTLEILPLVKAGYDPNSGVDNVLKADALAAGKTLSAFETLEQQIRFFADMPQKLEVDFLLANADDASKDTRELDQLVDAWAAGDTGKLESLLNGDMLTKHPELYRILLVERNKAFAAKIEELLKGDGVVFVAVGAGHLVGPDSVQADLAKDGIRAVRQ